MPEDPPDDHDVPQRGGSPRRSASAAVPPRTVRAGGALVALEGAVGLIVAIVLVVRAAGGHHDTGISGYGTAAWFAVLFGAVFAAGVALWLGRRGGRGVGILTQVLLAPVAFSLLGQSHQIAWGILLVIIIVPAFVLLVHPQTSAWMNRAYGSARDDDE